MGSRVRVEKFDDFDGNVRSDVETYSFVAPDGVRYEIDLNAEHFAEMELDFAKYIKAGRKAKRQGKTKGKARLLGVPVNEPKAPNKVSLWAKEINPWAADHGYDWEDPAQRKAVRQWGFEQGIYTSRVGVIPKHVMEAHYAARQKGEVPWPYT